MLLLLMSLLSLLLTSLMSLVILVVVVDDAGLDCLSLCLSLFCLFATCTLSFVGEGHTHTHTHDKKDEEKTKRGAEVLRSRMRCIRCQIFVSVVLVRTKSYSCFS